MYSPVKCSLLRVTHRILKHISVHTNKMAGFLFNALQKLWRYHCKEIRKHGSSVKMVSGKKKADMSQKQHYACKHCLTSPRIYTIECGHHAFETCEPVSVHKRVTETTNHLTPSSPWFTGKDRMDRERSLEVSQGWQTNSIMVLLLWVQQEISVPSWSQWTTEVTGGHEGVGEGRFNCT